MCLPQSVSFGRRMAKFHCVSGLRRNIIQQTSHTVLCYAVLCCTVCPWKLLLMLHSFSDSWESFECGQIRSTRQSLMYGFVGLFSFYSSFVAKIVVNAVTVYCIACFTLMIILDWRWNSYVTQNEWHKICNWYVSTKWNERSHADVPFLFWIWNQSNGTKRNATKKKIIIISICLNLECGLFAGFNVSLSRNNQIKGSLWLKSSHLSKAPTQHNVDICDIVQ